MVERAAELMDAHPTDELSLAALAKDLGVQTPSLYKHVNGLGQLRSAVTYSAKTELARDLAAATVGLSGPCAARALADAYRDYARRHPALYPLTVRAPEAGDHADEQISAALLGIVHAALGTHRLNETDAVHAVRVFRATVHGFISLESSGAFALPESTDQSFALAVERALGVQTR
ncbi:TetR/AcrR family transcriptional regulator [Galactobacter caseinivorans]|uniref:TetR/AcrR family transcriptional regulator n=1 Tax=Galactobacter caseinivorans TaxID=2676123 RepID=A0A496PKU4_9MICC|nr:TetR/AcrR family transcriptional regulator [Galactobacter caseinivorans]